MSLLLAVILAAPELTYWVGGSASSGVVLHKTIDEEKPDEPAETRLEPFASITSSQIEGNLRLKYGEIFVRLDIDFHYNPEHFDDAPDEPYAPEWAMLQYGREDWLVRAGVTNPQMGYEDWDDHINYLPTTSLLYDNLSPGRLLGVEPAVVLEDGTEMFAFGGYDLDFATEDDYFTRPDDLVAGFGVARSNDTYGTWSGVTFYPEQDLLGLYVAVELYPHDLLSVVVDGAFVHYSGDPEAANIMGAQIILNGLPDGLVSPVARVEYLSDSKDFLGVESGGVAQATASLGARSTPLEFLRVALEGKHSFYKEDAGLPENELFFTVSLFTPEPPAYDTEFEPEEEEGAGEEPAEGQQTPEGAVEPSDTPENSREQTTPPEAPATPEAPAAPEAPATPEAPPAPGSQP